MLRAQRRQQLKRRRQEESEAEVEQESIDEVSFNDTYNAIQLFTRRYVTPLRVYLGIGLVLRHQLYDYISNRTTVDKDIHSLREKGHIIVLRMQRLSNSINGIVLTSSYINLLTQELSISTEEKHRLKPIFQAFIENLPELSRYSDRLHLSKLRAMLLGGSCETNGSDNSEGCFDAAIT